MSLASWLERRILFFGGKGGVGKTTCATAFALYAARRGRRTLVVSTDPAHSTSDILQEPLGPEPRCVAESLWALEIDAAQEAEAYISGVRDHLMKVVNPTMRAEINRQIDMARVSPGAEEAALFDRIADLVESLKADYDLLIFDTAPTGHTLRLLTLPELMQVWMDGLISRRRHVNQLSRMWRNLTVGGAPDDEADPIERVLLERRRKFTRIRRSLLDATTTAFLFVVVPERLPILETEKAVRLLRRHEIPVGGLLVNRVLPADLPDHPFYTARKTQEAAYLADIDERFRDLFRIRLPLLSSDVVGRESLEEIMHHLEQASNGSSQRPPPP